jgi:hypothetical protein
MPCIFGQEQAANSQYYFIVIILSYVYCFEYLQSDADGLISISNGATMDIGCSRHAMRPGQWSKPARRSYAVFGSTADRRGGRPADSAASHFR